MAVKAPIALQPDHPTFYDVNQLVILTCPQLQKLCVQHFLPKKGNKADLVNRLLTLPPDAPTAATASQAHSAPTLAVAEQVAPSVAVGNPGSAATSGNLTAALAPAPNLASTLQQPEPTTLTATAPGFGRQPVGEGLWLFGQPAGISTGSDSLGTPGTDTPITNAQLSTGSPASPRVDALSGASADEQASELFDVSPTVAPGPSHAALQTINYPPPPVADQQAGASARAADAAGLGEPPEWVGFGAFGDVVGTPIVNTASGLGGVDSEDDINQEAGEPALGCVGFEGGGEEVGGDGRPSDILDHDKLWATICKQVQPARKPEDRRKAGDRGFRSLRLAAMKTARRTGYFIDISVYRDELPRSNANNADLYWFSPAYGSYIPGTAAFIHRERRMAIERSRKALATERVQALDAAYIQQRTLRQRAQREVEDVRDELEHERQKRRKVEANMVAAEAAAAKKQEEVAAALKTQYPNFDFASYGW